ncbi:holin [Undibacterium terreum]|uniref:Holin n=1 Tax=Undibacterium terreum TaxID=1224302 RepID=A0A916V0B9_9BURK|nr:holin [Undibacterium terreum]GGD00142.1 hypothetical protein GCM10011396_54580 [Undibacterium terreum]
MNNDAGFFATIWLLISKYILPLLPGAMGAAVSLSFLGDGINRWQKLTSFAIGFFFAIYVAPMLLELMSLKGEHVTPGVEFLVGLFALATCRELFKELNNADIIGSLKRKFLG